GRSRRRGVRPERGPPAPRLRLTPQGRGTTAPAPSPERTPAMRPDYPADYPLAALAACPSWPAFPDEPRTARPGIAWHDLDEYERTRTHDRPTPPGRASTLRPQLDFEGVLHA